MGYYVGWLPERGNVMKYKLRGDLSKTMVYMVVKQFAPDGIMLPTLRSCNFKKYQRTYWLVFEFDGHRFKACFDVCLGIPYVSYEVEEADMDSPSASVYGSFRRKVVNLTFDYLMANQLVREVA